MNDTPTPEPVRRRSGVRTAWLVIGSALTVVMLAMATIQVVELLAQSSESVERDFDPGDFDRLVVELDSGTVEIRGTDATARVAGTIHSGIATSRHQERIENRQLVVRVDCPAGFIAGRCDADLVIEVPRNVAVDLRSSNTSVAVSDLDGALNIRTSNSALRANRIRTTEPVELRSSNGSIEATAMSTPRLSLRTSNSSARAELDVAPSDLRVRSSNASAEAVIPDTGVAYDVTVETSNGDQQVAVRTDPTSDRRIEVRTSNDDASVRYAG